MGWSKPKVNDFSKSPALELAAAAKGVPVTNINDVIGCLTPPRSDRSTVTNRALITRVGLRACLVLRRGLCGHVPSKRERNTAGRLLEGVVYGAPAR